MPRRSRPPAGEIGPYGRTRPIFRGCRELASDTWLDNNAGQRAHEQLGFSEVNRVVNYRKVLDPDIVHGPARPPLLHGTDS